MEICGTELYVDKACNKKVSLFNTGFGLRSRNESKAAMMNLQASLYLRKLSIHEDCQKYRCIHLQSFVSGKVGSVSNFISSSVNQVFRTNFLHVELTLNNKNLFNVCSSFLEAPRVHQAVTVVNDGPRLKGLQMTGL